MLGTRRYTMSYFPYGGKNGYRYIEIYLSMLLYTQYLVHDHEANLLYFDDDDNFS